MIAHASFSEPPNDLPCIPKIRLFKASYYCSSEGTAEEVPADVVERRSEVALETNL